MRPETELQIAVARFLAVALRPPTFWTAIDAGAGKLSRTSARLAKARGVKPGFPDFLIMHPVGPLTRAIGIELKAGRNGLSDVQTIMHVDLSMARMTCHLCRSVDDVAVILAHYAVPMFAHIQGRAA